MRVNYKGNDKGNAGWVHGQYLRPGASADRLSNFRGVFWGSLRVMFPESPLLGELIGLTIGLVIDDLLVGFFPPRASEQLGALHAAVPAGYFAAKIWIIGDFTTLEIFLVMLFYAIMLAALNRASERFIDGFRYG